jgi:hypothetical protein
MAGEEAATTCQAADAEAKTGAASVAVLASGPSLQHGRLQGEEDLAAMTHNGGLCLMRRGRWSQTIDEVTVYVPLDLIDAAVDGGSIAYGKKLEVHIETTRVRTRSLSAPSSEFADILLARRVLPSQSSWFLSPGWLVLLLHKAPLTDAEQDAVSAGGEWWDRVCEGDERIETLSCSVGADVSSLPQHARDKAAREHARFQGLNPEEQRAELEALAGYKQVYIILLIVLNLADTRYA